MIPNPPARSYHSYQSGIFLFRGFKASAQCVNNLDVGIDMHISLVQMRQDIAAGLAAGKDLRKVVHGVIEAVQAERASARAVEMRLRFQTFFKNRFTPTVLDLNTAIEDWMREKDRVLVLGGVDRYSMKLLRQQEEAERRAACAARRLERQKQLAEERAAKSAEQREVNREKRQRRDEQREAKVIARQRRRELLQQKRLAVARVKLGRLRAMVLSLQSSLQKIRREKLLRAWGVPELPEGLQLNSFQSEDDSLCVTLRLSDGTEAGGSKLVHYNSISLQITLWHIMVMAHHPSPTIKPCYPVLSSLSIV